MLDKQTLDTVINKISELYRENIDILNTKYYETHKLEDKLKDDTLTVKEYKRLQEKLNVKTKEYKELNHKNEGVYMAREIVLNLYNDDMFEDENNGKGE